MNSKLNYILKRSIAYFIDVTLIYLIVMLVFQLLILVPIRSYLGIEDDWFKIGWNLQLYVWLTISLPVWLYFILYESSKHKATLGKRLMRLRVVNTTDNSKISLITSIKRVALKLLPWELIHIGLNLPTPVWFEGNPNFRYITLIGSLLFIGYFLTILFSRKKLSLYDRILGTKVITF